MATIFKFLEKYDKPAYKWAKNMERTLYVEPVSVLGFGGRFLEAIRNGLYQKHYKKMKNYGGNFSKDSNEEKILGDSFKRDDVSKHISNLGHAGVIKRSEAEKIINAYKIRNDLHYNDDTLDIEYDRQAAKKLFKEVFDISVWYCKHLDPIFDEEGVEFKYPPKEEKKKQMPDVNLVKIFDTCIICGKPNNTTHRNICPECKRRMRLGSDLKDLLDILENEKRFTKAFLKKNSYDKFEIDYLIHFLREFDLITSETKGEYYLSDSNRLFELIDETSSYDKMERILIAYYNELIDYDFIRYDEESFYALGKKGKKPYKEYYNRVIDKKIKHYLNLKQRNLNPKTPWMNILHTHNEKFALDESGVSIDEISYWYGKKLKEIVLNKNNKRKSISFEQMSKILMAKWIKSREERIKKEDIAEELMLNDEILDFWFDETLKSEKYSYVREFTAKNKEIEMNLFTEGLAKGMNKQEAMEYADTELEFVNKQFNLNQEEHLKQRWKYLNRHQYIEYFYRYKNIYFHKKSREFLEDLNGSSIESALEESNLDEGDFNIWYGSGKKEFLKHDANMESELFRFYVKTSEILMENWLDERRKGHKKAESCENIGLFRETLDEWFRFERNTPKDFDNKKYDLFKEFYIKSDEVTMNLVIKSIEEGKNKSKIAKDVDTSIEEIDMCYEVGKILKYIDEEELIDDKSIEESAEKEEINENIFPNYIIENKTQYIDFYEKYDEIYFSKRVEDFLNYCEKKGDVLKAVKNSELSLEEIEFMYNSGKEGDEGYVEFYENLLDIKLKIYASALAKSKKNKKIIKMADLSEEEIEENEYQIDSLILISGMIAVLDAVPNKKLDKVVNKFNFSIDDVFGWYEKGRELMKENDVEYLDIDDIMPDGKINFFGYLTEDVDYETNYDKDFDSYYMRFYNLYNEIHVKPNSKILSRNYTEDKTFLRYILKDLKVSQKEYDFWKSLGLIKNEREIKLDEDEEMIESNEKIKYHIIRR